MQEVDDWVLIAQARAGNGRSFETLVRRYEQPIMHFCRRMLGNRGDAEDIAQECFLSLHRSLHRIEPRAKFSTLLFGIARNLSLNLLRDDRRRGRDSARSLDGMEFDPPGGPRPDRNAQNAELGRRIEDAIGRLSPEFREVLVLREINQLDYEAIAAAVGCPVGTVRSRLARARESMRAMLAGELDGV